MPKRLLIIGALVALAAIPAAVLAASKVLGGAADRQAAKWTTRDATTSSRSWRNVPRLSLTRCTRNQVTATVSGTVTGPRVVFRVVIDGVPEAPMRPAKAAFAPDGAEAFSYTFVGRTGPFEADDTHSFNVQWRSPTGSAVKLRRGVLNLLFERGREGCP